MKRRIKVEEYVAVTRTRTIEVELTDEEESALLARNGKKNLLDMDEEGDKDIINGIASKIDKDEYREIELHKTEYNELFCIMRAKIIE